MITFERIGKEELPPACQIYNHYSLNSTATFRDTPVTIREFSRLIAMRSAGYPSFLIREEHKILGFCVLNRYKPLNSYDRTAEVTIYHVPDQCSRGIGRTVLGHLEETARDRGIRVLLATITNENQRSIRLFERMGYVRCAYLRSVGEMYGRILDLVMYQKIL